MRPPCPRRGCSVRLALLGAVLAGCGPRATPAAPAAPSREPLLLDVDMGLDDARVLVALPAQRRFRLLAVVTVAGSASAERGAENALRLLAALGVDDVPVAVGARRALDRPVPAPPWRRLTEELGGLELPPAARALEAASGEAVLRATLRRASAASVTVLALGPLTNLALALRAEPALTRRVRALYLLGDFVRCDCYNCRVDPTAAREVLVRGIPTYMVLRSATDRAPFTPALLEQVARRRGPAARLVARFMARHAANSVKLWDDAVLAGLLDDHVLTYVPYTGGSLPAGAVLHGASDLDPRRLEEVLLRLWDTPLPIARVERIR